MKTSIVLILVSLMAPTAMAAFDANKPADTRAWDLRDDDCRTNFAALESIFGIGSNGTDVNMIFVESVDASGADDTGATDSSTAIQSAVDAAELSGLPVWFSPGGTYLVETSITIDADITIWSKGATLLMAPGGFNIVGSVATATDAVVTTDIVKGESNVLVESSAGLAAGDLVLLESQVVDMNSTADYAYGFAEAKHIEQVVSSTKIQFSTPATWFYDVNETGDDDDSRYNAYAFYQDPNVAVYSPISVTIEGLHFQGKADTTHLFISAEYCRPLVIRNCTFEPLGTMSVSGYAVFVDHCQQVEMTGCIWAAPEDIDDSGTKGPRFESCTHLNIHHNQIYNTQATGWFFQYCAYLNVNDNIGTRMGGSSMWFEQCSYVEANNNNISWCQNTLAERQASHTSSACLTFDGVSHGQINGGTYDGGIGEGCLYIRSGNYTYWSLSSGDTTSTIDYHTDYMVPNEHISLTGVTVHAVEPNSVNEGYGFYAKSRVRNLTISDCFFESGSHGIWLAGDCNGVRIQGNSVHYGNTTAGSGVRLSHYAPYSCPRNISIVNNTFYENAGVAATSGTSIYFLAGTDLEIKGNRFISENNDNGDDHVINFTPMDAESPAAMEEWLDSVVVITDNIIRNDGAATRGINSSQSSATNPTGNGDVLISDNVVDVAGVPYTNIGHFVDEIHSTYVDVNNADMNDLATSAYELVAAQGAGTLIEFVSAILILDYGSDALTEPSAPDDLAIEYDDGTGQQIITWDTTGFITSAADAIEIVNSASVGGGAAAVTAAANVNKNIALINTGTDYTGNGSEDTVLRVIVTYRVHRGLGL